jgi:hypothetical protein
MKISGSIETSYRKSGIAVEIHQWRESAISNTVEAHRMRNNAKIWQWRQRHRSAKMALWLVISAANRGNNASYHDIISI